MSSGKGMRLAVNGYVAIATRVAGVVAKQRVIQLAGVTGIAVDLGPRAALGIGMSRW